ncbi:adenylate/guanylate cyclase domain-containing protein [Lewinella sp. IMCC34191]|uniref:adenylate/guanylate cyclase domain-containing protein n=1 Tax=Lewinella sp. IMCC34191 TaxID=2259172 RepID=UPI000E22536F|nr:adenylate/guanylate cyclase domain-containing protein [Lewinella sp. IMCC34191]
MIAKNKLLYWLRLVLTWWVATFLFSFLRHYGWPERMAFAPDYLIAPALDFSLALIVGTGYFGIELLLNRQAFMRLSFLWWALLKVVLQFLLAIALFAVGLNLYPLFNSTAVQDLTLEEFLGSKLMVVVLVYFLLISLLITLFQRMYQKVGPGIFGNMLVGRYHKPREEERIFLFIDLRDSTPIAERLGHLLFSQLIQDCFADVTDAVIHHQAEIYQYVGDEVILCWKTKPGLKHNNCIAAFFEFDRILARRSGYYESNYGFHPEFKAAAHIGRTTVAEVGVVKRELAYHGDVLNTTARIQSKCNELGEQLLISPALSARLDLDRDYITHEYPPVELTGKRYSLPVIGIRARSLPV